MSARSYADESYRHSYLLAIAVIDFSQEAQVRKELRRLCLPGQYRLHMKNERDSRRRALLAELSRMPLSVHMVENRKPHRFRRITRDECLGEAVRILAALQVGELILESCGQDPVDRRVLARESMGQENSLKYSHTSPALEPLLWPSDLAAWAFGKGGHWRNQLGNLIGSVTRLGV